MTATASKAVRKPEDMADAELVELALDLSRKTARRFAEDVVGCDESSLRRWRHGYQAMNAKRRRWFINYLEATLPSRHLHP